MAKFGQFQCRFMAPKQRFFWLWNLFAELGLAPWVDPCPPWFVEPVAGYSGTQLSNSGATIAPFCFHHTFLYQQELELCIYVPCVFHQ